MKELMQCEELFYGKNDIEQAYKMIKLLFNKDKNNEEIFNLYLSILYFYDKLEALNIAENNKNKLISNLVLIDNYTKGDFLLAEDLLLEAEKKWENNLLLQCRKIVLLKNVYQTTKRKSILTEINKIIKLLPEATNKVERTWKEKVLEIKNGNYDSVFYTREYCDDKDIYYELFVRDFAMSKDELVVDKEGNGDFKTISQALAVAKEGALIRINYGTYNETIQIDKPVTLRGEGESLPIIFKNKGTVCIVNADTCISNIRISNHNLTNKDEDLFSMILLNSDTDFRNCEIVGSVDTNIEVAKGKASLDNCIISGAKGYGVILGEKTSLQCVNSKIYQNKKTAVKANNASISVKETEIFDNGHAFEFNNGQGNFDSLKVNNNIGYGLVSKGKSEFTVNNCIISSCKEGGILCFDTTNIFFEGCEIIANNGNGLTLKDETFAKLINSKIIDNFGNGFLLEKNANAKIDNTEFANSKEANILVDSVESIFITNCSIHSGYYKGLYFSTESKVSLFNCAIYENKEENVFIEGNAKPLFKECHIYNGQDYGIKIKGNAHPSFENCSIYDNKSINICVLEKSNIDLKNCKVYFSAEHTKSEVNIYADDNTEGNISECIIDGGHIGIKSRLETYLVIDNCKIQNVDRYCIHVMKGSASEILNCEISNSKEAGVYVSEDGAPLVDSCDIHNNELAGIVLDRDCSGLYTECMIHNNDQGIYLDGDSVGSPAGTFSCNELYDNKYCDFRGTVSIGDKQSIFNQNFSSEIYKIVDGQVYKTLLGIYPQTLKIKSVKIDENKTYNKQGWECYHGSDGFYYVKAVSKESEFAETFNDGSQVEQGKPYFFKLEPIAWRAITKDVYMSSKIIDATQFDKHFDTDEYDEPPRIVEGNEIHSNNYKYSLIRAYLNGLDGSSYDVDNFVGRGFIDKAFTDVSKEYLLDNKVINDTVFGSEDPEFIKLYTSGTTTDKIFLFGQEDMNNKIYRLKMKIYAPMQITDYAIAMGAHADCHTDAKGNLIHFGTYGLRTPGSFGTEYASISSNNFQMNAWNTLDPIGVAPVIRIDLSKLKGYH